MKKDYLGAWDRCMDVIKEHVNTQTLRTWFDPIKAVKLEGDILTIEVPNQFFYEWLEENFLNVLRQAIGQVLGKNGRLEYRFKVEKNNGEHNASRNTDSEELEGGISPNEIQNPFVIPGIKRVKVNPQLNIAYRLDNYIEGDCNSLARSAGKAIADRPGETAFNPLFIFGEVGLGKTHLAQAIGNEVLDKHPSKSVLYVSTEKFTNQLIQSIKNGSVTDFTNFYQLVDVLIVDDIQFLADKKKTQEIFFNIFNHLKQCGKQIILTSDCPPSEMQGVQDRLLSRFKWGLEADLSRPKLETRIAIMEAKMVKENIDVPREVSSFICTHIKNNIRELEGVLIQLIAQATLNQREIDMDLAREVIKRMNNNESKEITVDLIKEMVSEFFGIDVEKLGSKTRKQDIATARHLSIYFSKEYTKNSLKSIGSYFGGRDHSTILHSCRTVKDRMDTDRAFKDTVASLEQKMQLSLM